jgi:lysozyme
VQHKDEDGMKNRHIHTAIVLGAAAGLLILLFFAVKTKKLQINRWIVSDRDVIGADISEYQADVDMPVLMEQGIEFVYIKATEGSGHVDSRFADNWENAV